jgi:toxin secretion/phage lysis holin
MQDYISSFFLTLSGAVEYWIPKLFSATVFTATFNFLFGEGNELMLLAMVGLVIFDFVTGVSAAYTNSEAITSRRIFKTAIKLSVYSILIAAANMVEVCIPGDPFFISNIVISFLAITELISILENAGKMGYLIPQRLLNQLKEYRDGQALVETRAQNREERAQERSTRAQDRETRAQDRDCKNK